MAKYDCEICCGRGVVILPIYRRASAGAFASIDIQSATPEIEQTSKQFPCPECAPTTPIDRIAIVDFHGMVSSSAMDEPGFIKHAQEGVAHRAVDEILRRGFIQFRTEPPDKFSLTTKMIGTIAVVAPAHVATMQQRIQEHQTEFAIDMAKEAIAQIDNWGSHFGHSDILKRDARRLIGEALTTTIAKHLTEKK